MDHAFPPSPGPPSPPVNGALEALQRENEKLRRRLEEAGQALVDSRNRPVDAVEGAGFPVRQQAEARAQQELRETAFANRVLRAFVEQDGDALFDQVLGIVLEEMASHHGIFGYIAQPGHLFCPSLSKMLAACEVAGKCIHYPPEKWKGLWARALTEKRSFYTNDPPPLPAGHVIIHNNLATPILFRGEAIGLLNVANKEGGYSEGDRELLDRIAARVAPVLYAWIQRKLRDDERATAAAALQESEVKYRSLFESIDEGFCLIEVIFDGDEKAVDYRFLEINPAFKRHTGLFNARGCRMRELAPAHEEHWFETYGRIAMTGEAIRFQNEAAALGRWYDVYAWRHGAPGNRQVAILFNDISERKQAEGRLRASEARLDAVLQQLPVGVGLMDCNGRWVLSNPVMDALVPEAIPSTVPERRVRWRAFDAENRPVPPENWPGQRALRGETVSPGLEMIFTDDDGRERWMRVSAAPLRDAAGAILGATCVVQDIDVIRRSEQQVRESQATLQSFYDSAPMLMGIAELDGDRCVAVSGNPAAAAFFATTPGQLPGQTGPGLGNPAELERLWVESYRRSQDAGAPVKFEYEHPRPAGTCWLKATVAFIGLGPAGRPRFSFVAEDITARKRRELNASLLNEIGNELSVRSAPDDIVQIVGERLGKFLHASTCILADVDEANNEATIDYGWNATGIPSLRQTFRLAEYFGEEFLRAGRAGETVVVRDTARDPRANAEAYARLQLGAFVTVPFQRQGRWVANLTVTSREPREWRTDEIELVQEIASRVFPRVEHARAEAALRESEARFRLALNNSPVLVTMQDTKLVYQWVFNTRTRRPEECVGKTDVDLFAPDEAEAVIATKRQVLETGTELRRSFWLTSNGQRVFLDCYYEPVRDAAGQIVGVGGASVNLTEQKLAEDALARTTVLLETLLATAPLGFCYFDRDLRYVRINDRLAEMNGLPAAAHLGKTVGEIVPALSLEVQEITERILATGEAVVGHELSGETPAQPGVTRHWSETWYPVRDASGAIAGFGVIVEEITERKHAEAAQRESEERMQEALRVSRSFTFEWDPASDRVLRSNSCAPLLGLAGEEATAGTGQRYFQRVHPDDRERFVALLGRLQPGADRYETQYRIVRPGGDVTVLEESGRGFFDASSQLCRVIGVTTDITARHEAEAALRQSREDLDRAQAVGQIGSWRLDTRKDVLTWSDENYRIFGVPKGTPLSYESFLTAVHPDDREYVDAQWRAAMRGEPYDIEHRIVANGQVKWVREKAYLELEGDGQLLGGFGITQDITARKQAKHEREIAAQFLALVNASRGLRPLLQAATGFFREQCGCEAAGIRLKDGDDFPYFETQGFPAEFVRLENSLCCREPDGTVQRDHAGNPVIACMCGNVICGRTDPAKPFFTPAGSFWANSTSRLLATTSDADRQARTRNRCHGEGYESVALIA